MLTYKFYLTLTVDLWDLEVSNITVLKMIRNQVEASSIQLPRAPSLHHVPSLLGIGGGVHIHVCHYICLIKVFLSPFGLWLPS